MRARVIASMLFASSALVLSGCGTIAHGRYQEVPVTSTPAGAHVSVDCGKGVKDAGVTPAIVQLRRKSDRCLVTLSKDGYEESSLVFRRGLSGWVWGNLLLPYVALPSFLVDLGNGAAYKQHPYSADATLRQNTGGGSAGGAK